MFYFSKKVRLFSQNGLLFLFYFLINPTMTTAYDFAKFSQILHEIERIWAPLRSATDIVLMVTGT